MFSIIDAVRKYLHGESKEVIASKFEDTYNEIEKCRIEMSGLVKGMAAISENVDTIKKGANDVLKGADVTADNVKIVLDNIMLSDAKLKSYAENFSSEVKGVSDRLAKAESEMARLVMDNPNLASILADVNHDENLYKSLCVVFDGYLAKAVTKEDAIKAYKEAEGKRRTDRPFTKVLDKLNDASHD